MRSQWGREDPYLVRAMTLFFLGCWLTGLPMLPFFREPFRASSRCFSAENMGKKLCPAQRLPGPAAASPPCLSQMPGRAVPKGHLPYWAAQTQHR